MIFLLRGLPVLIELGVLLYCLIDCVQTPEDQVRNLPRWAWIVLILFFPIVGGVAWLVAGRPSRARHQGFGPVVRRPERPVVGPDDDPDFLAQLRQVDDEHEQTLNRWEEDLRHREEELRERRDDEPPPGRDSER